MLAFESGATFALRIQSQSSDNNTLTIRGMTKEGPFVLSHTTNANRSTQTETFNLPDIPIWVTVSDDLFNFVQGDCFINLSLVVNGDILYQLANGLVYYHNNISWPTNNIIENRQKPGRIRTVNGTDPAAGSEISQTVPNGAMWKLKGVRIPFVTAATAGSRRVHLVINDSVNDIIDIFGNVDQIISEAKQYTFTPFLNVPDETDDNDILVSIPNDIILFAPMIIKTITTNLAGGDNFGQPIFYVEDWFYPLG